MGLADDLRLWLRDGPDFNGILFTIISRLCDLASLCAKTSIISLRKTKSQSLFLEENTSISC